MTIEKKTLPFAGFWVRVAALIIDGLIISLLAAISAITLTWFLHAIVSSEFVLILVIFALLSSSLIITIFYFGWYNANGRQSPGKRFFRLLVVNDSFNPVPFRRSLWRALVYAFGSLLLGLGHLLILFNKKKRALHDFIAHTFVIRAEPRRKKEPLLIFALLMFALFFPDIPKGLLNIFSMQSFRIPTGGTKPTLLIGDFILVDKFIYGVRTPSRIPLIDVRIPVFRLPACALPKAGDLIVFKYPKDERLNYIKRCIAVGGQTVQIRRGAVFVDGAPEAERVHVSKEYDTEEGREVETFKIRIFNNKYYLIRHYVNGYDQAEDFGPVKVPESHYFVLGDHRDNSSDSRVWGFVPHENIVGKAGLIYFSWDTANNNVRWPRIGKIIN